MTEPVETKSQPGSQPAPLSNRDRWVKRIFIILALIGMVVIWQMHKYEPTIRYTTADDLTGATALAETSGGNVLIFFHRRPMERRDRDVIQRAINHAGTPAALERARLQFIALAVDDHVEFARRYEINDGNVPAFLIIAPDGAEISKSVRYFSAQPEDFHNRVIGVDVREEEAGGDASGEDR